MGVKPAAEAASAQQQGDEVDWKCLHYIEPLIKVRVHFNWFMSGEWAVVECAGCGIIHPLVSCQRWVDFVYVHTTADNIIRLCMYFSLSPQRSLNIFYLYLSLFYLVLSFKEFLRVVLLSLFIEMYWLPTTSTSLYLLVLCTLERDRQNPRDRWNNFVNILNYTHFKCYVPFSVL